MLTDAEARQLHDRASRGETLTSVEQTTLDEWYARQDREETAALSRSPTSPSASLRTQVDAVASRLHVVSGRIRVLTAENESLRQEIAALQRRLAEKTVAQAT